MKLDTIMVWSVRLVVSMMVVFAVNWTDSGRPVGVERARSVVIDPAQTNNILETESQATFLAVGDIMFSRGVNRIIDREGDRLLPFSRMAELLSSADFSFGNFESPVSGNDARVGKGLVFNTHRHDVGGLIKYKFKIVGLANNHALDQGVSGLRYTRAYLSGLGIEHIGAGSNRDEAWRGKVVTANGIRIGFIAASYSSINDDGSTRNKYVARIDEYDHLRASISRLRGESDIVVVAMHAGREYTRRPHRSQVEFARAAIDRGADMVIGSHPHWIQTIERYRGKYIFYSLGNFIFDQRQPGTREGLMLRVVVRRGRLEGSEEYSVYLDNVELLPVIIERGGVPRRATDAESAAILLKIGVADAMLVLKDNDRDRRIR